MTDAIGMDLSAWQTSTPSMSGQDFIIARGSYGDNADGYYLQHQRAARAADAIVGSYLFGRNMDPARQVMALLSVASGADFFCVDYESDKGHPTIGKDQVRECVRRLQTTGKHVGLYATPSTMFDAGQDFEWYADPGPIDAPKSWDFIQRHSGVPSGNHYNGTRADLEAWLGMALLQVTNDHPHRIRVPKGANLYALNGHVIKTAATAIDRESPWNVTIGPDGNHYWMIRTGVAGDPAIVLVRASQVTDEGPVTDSGPDAGDVATARLAGFADAKAKAITAVGGI